MVVLQPGWYSQTGTPGTKRWWNGTAWEDKWQHDTDVFRIRYIELAPDGSRRITELAQTFTTAAEAEAFINAVVQQAFEGRIPRGNEFEIYRLDREGKEESYGKWLGKRFARIGVAAAVGTAIGLLLGG